MKGKLGALFIAICLLANSASAKTLNCPSEELNQSHLSVRNFEQNDEGEFSGDFILEVNLAAKSEDEVEKGRFVDTFKSPLKENSLTLMDRYLFEVKLIKLGSDWGAEVKIFGSEDPIRLFCH